MGAPFPRNHTSSVCVTKKDAFVQAFTSEFIPLAEKDAYMQVLITHLTE